MYDNKTNDELIELLEQKDQSIEALEEDVAMYEGRANYLEGLKDEKVELIEKAGCTAKVSQDEADATVKAYKENRFTTVPKLIDAAIVNAKKLIVKPSKNVKVK